MQYRNIGSFAIIFAAVLWSLDGLLRRHLYHVPSTVIVFWEHAFGLIILLAVTSRSWKKFRELNRKQWATIIFVALLSGTLGTIFYTAALAQVHYVSYSAVVLLQQLQPLFAIAAAVIFLREKITARYLGLAVLAIAAAYLLSFPNLTVSLESGQGIVAAALLAIGAAACWGISTALSKYTLRDTSVLHVTTLRFLFTVVFSFLIAMLLGHADSITTITPSDVLYIAIITASTGMVALALYYFGLQRVLASRSTILELTWPLSAAVMGFVILHERLTPTQWIGAVLLIAVMRIIIRSQRVLVVGETILEN